MDISLGHTHVYNEPNRKLRRVWWKGRNNWHAYSCDLELSILKALKKHVAFLNLGLINSEIHPEGSKYLADLKNMQQINMLSGMRREIIVLSDDDSEKTRIRGNKNLPFKSSVFLFIFSQGGDLWLQL